jgi:putative FmdB family regulatory protein
MCPTYQYECSSCQHKFEEFKSIKTPPIKICPKCGKKKVQRIISGGTGIIFLGSVGPPKGNK